MVLFAPLFRFFLPIFPVYCAVWPDVAVDATICGGAVLGSGGGKIKKVNKIENLLDKNRLKLNIMALNLYELGFCSPADAGCFKGTVSASC